jgi:acetoin utilization protein AcuB
MLTVAQIMTRGLVTVSPDSPIERARWLLREHEVRHLPVVEHERLVGIVSERDLMERPEAAPRRRGIEKPASETPVRDRMSVSVETVALDESALRACKRMHERRISSLPVVSGSRVAGILSELDLLRLYERVCRFTGHDPALDPLVESRMSRDPVVVAPDATALEAFDLCRSKGFRHLPVVHDGWLVGMISDRDLLPVLGEALGETRRVEDVMTKDYVGVVPGTRLSAVAECMLKNGFHALPVLVNGALRGIVTSADVLEALCAIDEEALEAAWTGEAALSAERIEE